MVERRAERRPKINPDGSMGIDLDALGSNPTLLALIGLAENLFGGSRAAPAESLTAVDREVLNEFAREKVREKQLVNEGYAEMNRILRDVKSVKFETEGKSE